MPKIKRVLLLSTAFVLLSDLAFAQTSPGWTFGFTPTAAQWNAAFAGKQDYTGTVPLNISGGTMLGELTTTASTINSAGFNITPGTAPNSPNNGDMWTTAAGLFVQINGSTAQLSAGTAGSSSLLSTNNTWTGTNQFNLSTTFGSGVTFNVGAPATVNGTFTFGAFTYFNYNAATVAPSTGTGAAISNNFSNGNLETDVWNTGTGAAVSFIFKQMTGAGTFKNLVDVSLGTGSAGGIIDIYGLTSGKISLMGGSAAAGTYNWIYPTTAGNAGQILTSQGGTGAMTWTNAGAGTVTSAQVSGSAGITVSGTCTITTTGNCGVGAFLGPPQGRLTLISGQPVMTAAPGFNNGTAGAQTLYYAPYAGMTVPINTGAALLSYQFTTGLSDAVGQSISLAGGTAWVANTVYDVYEALNGTSLTLCTGSAWSSTTSRGTVGGANLTRISGILTNTGTMTCRSGSATTFTVNANRGTYLGTFATDAGTAGQITYTTGSGASGGSAAVMNLWNFYNRINTVVTVIDTGATYTYTSATTRAARASNSNRIIFTSGVLEDGFQSAYTAEITLQNSLTANSLYGIGLNSTSSFSCQYNIFINQNSTNQSNLSNSATNNCPIQAQLGQNFIQALEASDGTTTNTFDSASLNNLTATIRN